MNNLRILLNDIRKSKWLVIALTIELILCMLLMTIAMTMLRQNRTSEVFYDSSMKDNAYVQFDFVNRKIGDISKTLDVTDLATTSNLYDYDNDMDIIMITPTAVKRLPKLNFDFNPNHKGDIAEGYVSKKHSGKYKKGDIVEINQKYSVKLPPDEGSALPPYNSGSGNNDKWESRNYVIKFSVKGYFDPNYAYYDISYSNVLGLIDDIVICSELPEFAEVDAGIFFNDKDVNYYLNNGFNARSCEEVVAAMKDGSNYSFFLYIAIIVVVLSAVTIMFNYIINVNKVTKSNAVYFLCGKSPKWGVAMELVKLVAIYGFSFIVGLGLSAALSRVKVMSSLGMTDAPSFFSAAAIILVVFASSAAVGIIKVFRTKPLKILRGESVE